MKVIDHGYVLFHANAVPRFQKFFFFSSSRYVLSSTNLILESGSTSLAQPEISCKNTHRWFHRVRVRLGLTKRLWSILEKLWTLIRIMIFHGDSWHFMFPFCVKSLIFRVIFSPVHFKPLPKFLYAFIFSLGKNIQKSESFSTHVQTTTFSLNSAIVKDIFY